MKIIRQYTADDYVISEFIMRGTHRGDFVGITPTNQVLEITGVDIDKVVDGSLVFVGALLFLAPIVLHHQVGDGGEDALVGEAPQTEGL
mgnify:CR=1 FL=1